MVTRKTELFDYLVFGVKEHLERDKKYPYPDLLCHAMNALSLEMKKSVSFPKTIQGFLQLLEKPVKDWCPSSFIPVDFDRDFGLMDEGSLSEAANEYLYEDLINKGGVPENASPYAQQLAISNKKFISILDKLKDIYNNTNPEIAQQEYILFRRFIIQNPYTSTREIRAEFLKAKYISIEEIGELYEECHDDQTYWRCDRCGLLTEKYGRLKGIKPCLCGNHHQNQSYVHQVKWETDLRRIKDGIHQRVCFPGIPELNLYSVLQELSENYPDYLQQIKLYPGLDRYDLQLHFGDRTVWAINFKDVRDPYKLAKNLNPLYGEGNLHHDESFYVISDRCIQASPDYVEIARKAAMSLPVETQLMSDKSFRTKVNNKVATLKKGAKS
jgi:REase associating with pPIWI_RE